MKNLMQLTHELGQLTSAAVKCCEDEDWQSLELYQEQRAVVLQALKEQLEQAPLVERDTAEAFREVIEATRLADQRIEAEVRAKRQQLMEEHSELQKTDKARRAYTRFD
ncbi:hypothetical protein [Nitrincola tapanii]|uniref:Flagellar protein FliT n=1 Tax=Nitrincola tapanii TaxID=1708751 RepID=A0A5A9W720_9GAMM|nr:hypothetical protein [Nitrincola tapanii]KAA0876590.1 hypothetical protein E1H14_02405 [Nitrincola tapanii]